MTFPVFHLLSSGIMELHRFVICGSSMLPNLKNGQEVALFGRPEDVTRESIVAFGNPETGEVSVKREVALTGG